MTKEEVRKKAIALGIRVANKPDSQEICFVDNDYTEFIKQYSNPTIYPGDFLDTAGNVIGKHTGIINYTIGQRKGLGGHFGQRLYVKSINPDNNTVVLGKNTDLFSNKLTASDINLVLGSDSPLPSNIQAKIRYASPCSDATLRITQDNQVSIEFTEHQRAITPGQSVVFYDNDIVLGGGIII
jgi:tRNA-specific 2-thiouridylase